MRLRFLSAIFGVTLLFNAGCDKIPGLSLSKGKDAIPADGPRLGALSPVTPVFAEPDKKSLLIGYLHAGAQVPRAKKTVEGTGCKQGWYRIRPRGFVCVGETATLDLKHPTLVAMALRPERTRSLPYAYARTTRATSLFRRDEAQPGRIAQAGRLRTQSGMALVGSWTAQDATGQSRRLAMTTGGQFVPVEDVRRAEPPEFSGVELGDRELPVAFVVKRKARRWSIADGKPEKETTLGYHDSLELTGTVELLGDDEYWTTPLGDHVRGTDVQIAEPRGDFPSWAEDEALWLDINITRRTLVAYEGKKPVFATLVSIGEDARKTVLGEHEITEKHITLPTQDPGDPALAFDVYDAPWVMRLSSGQLLYGAYWHQRFGRAHTSGSIELSPTDAAHLWRWAAPIVPAEWHGVVGKADDESPVRVLIRK
jgi:hypothetical protein